VNVLSVFDKDAGTTQDRVSHFFRSVVWSQYETDLFLIFFDGYTAGNFRDRGDTFWCASFEEFLSTWQTLGNIIGRCDTTGVERTHRQLSTWLTNGLGCDNSNDFSDIDDLTCSIRTTVALGTASNHGIDGQYYADSEFGDAGL